jgi:hypothetical protein
MSQVGGQELAAIVGGLLGVAGLLTCCGCCMCRRHRHRLQRRRPATRRIVRPPHPDPDTDPDTDDLELGLAGGAHLVARQPPPTAMDSEVGHGRRTRTRGVTPPRRSHSAPPLLGRPVHGAAPTTDSDFIDLHFDAEGGPHWNHATGGDGDGTGGGIPHVD